LKNSAAQVLSLTVANAVEHCYGPSVQATVGFIRMMDKWFDVLNVKNLYEGKHKRNENLKPFTDINDPRLWWLEDFLARSANLLEGLYILLVLISYFLYLFIFLL